MPAKSKPNAQKCATCPAYLTAPPFYEVKFWLHGTDAPIQNPVEVLKIVQSRPLTYGYLGTLLICKKCGDKWAASLYAETAKFEKEQKERYDHT